jgi:hypothetical protein
MRLKNIVAGALGGVAMLALAAGPATAFLAPNPTSLVGPNDVAGTTNTVEVVKGTSAFTGDSLTANFSGLVADAANPAFNAFLCNPKAATGTYNGATDCISLTAPVVNSTSGGGIIAGIKTGDGGHESRTVNGNTDWECDVTGSPTGVVDPTDYGVGPTKVYSDCYVVIREGSLFDTSDSKNELFPVKFVTGAPPQDVPEARFAILLPLGGLAAVGGAYFILRRRTPSMA